MNYYTILWMDGAISEYHRWSTDQWENIWNWWLE